MSQSNKSNVAKKTFFMLLIFTVICASVTFALIHNTIEQKKEEVLKQQALFTSMKEAEEKINNKEVLEGPDLIDKYTTNGITIKNIDISEGEVIHYNEYSNNIQRKLEINYVKISGLKNTKIQDKINEDIENKVLSLKDDSELADSEINNITIGADIYANFSDTISISIYKYVVRKYPKENPEYENDYTYDYDYTYSGLNYSLATGEQIEFEDIFTDDAPIKTILNQAFYDSFAWQYLYDEEGEYIEWSDMDYVDYGKIEDKVFKAVAKYNRNPEYFNFYYGPAYVYLIDNINNETHVISLADFNEHVAIYERFKAEENLYEDESLIKTIDYVFTNFEMADYLREDSLKTDNFRIRILNSDGYEENNQLKLAAELAAEKEIYDKINEYAVLANQNKDKGYIFEAMYYGNANDEKAGFYYEGRLCSMDRQYFEEELDYTIATAMREERVEFIAIDYSYVDKENVIFEEYISNSVKDYQNITEEERELFIETREDREKLMAEDSE